MLILEIPIVSLILWRTFTPSQKTMDSSVRKLKVQVAKKGKLNANQIMAIGIFILVFLGWIFFSPIFGLGTVASRGLFTPHNFAADQCHSGAPLEGPAIEGGVGALARARADVKSPFSFRINHSHISVGAFA